MTKILLTICCFVLISSISTVRAQDAFTVRVRAGEDPNKAIPTNVRFRFGEFQDGALYYAYDSHSPTFKMNYSLMLGSLMFIDLKGDTMVVSNEFAVKYVKIGDTYFYHNFPDGYYEMLVYDDDFILAVKEEMKLVAREMQGTNGYGKTDPQTSVISMRYSVRSPTTNIMNQDVIYRKVFHYILIDPNRVVRPANKNAFLSALPQFEKEIQSYIDREHVSFNGANDDIVRLAKFCEQL